MFGKKTIKEDKEMTKVMQAVSDNTPDLVVEQPANMGMPGFTAEPEPAAAVAPAPAPAPIAAPAPAPAQQGIPGFGSIGAPAPMQEPEPAPVPKAKPIPKAKPAPVPKVQEQYQIVEVAMGPEGLYVYKVVTNKYLGELGGVYEA